MLAKIVLPLLAALSLTSTVALARDVESNHSLNLVLNPLSLASGTLDGGVDFKVSDKVTVGPYAQISLARKSGIVSDGFGARADIMLGSHGAFTDGWYVSPFISHYQWTFHDVKTDESSTAVVQDLKLKATNVGGIIGYGWFWKPGINLRLGGGLMYTSVDGDYRAAITGATLGETAPHYQGILPAGELKLAWAL